MTATSLRARIKLAMTALAIMFVTDVATYIVQAITTNESALAVTYSVAFLINIAAFVAAYVIFWKWPVSTDGQKRWIKIGIWLATVQAIASIFFIVVQWTPEFQLTTGEITAMSLIPMILYGIENIAATVIVVWKWNA